MCKDFRIYSYIAKSTTKKQSQNKENFDEMFSQENQCFCLKNQVLK